MSFRPETAQDLSDSIAPVETAPEKRNNYTIGDLAREFGVTLRTLRFYEDRGLLAPVRVGTSRIYNERDRARLSVILKGKQLGFTLAEIEDMIASEDRDEATVVDLKLSLEQIDSQILHLERQKTEVEEALVELRTAREKLIA